MTEKDDGFNEYKYLMKEKINQFDHCRATHGEELKDIRDKLEEMRKDILKEAKEITSAINKMDKD